MLETVLEIPFWVELVATLTGGVSGAIHAVKHDYDIFGVMCVACVTGLSGGIIRDVLLQDYGIYAFQHPELIITCAAVALLVFFFCRFFDKLDLPMDVIDTISVAMWAVIGTGKGLSAGYGILPAALLGLITAIGGGIIRDILLARKPRVFLGGTLYASAAFIGSLAFAVLKQYEVLPLYNAIICVGFIVVLRLVSVLFHIELGPARDYSDDVKRFLVRVRSHFGRKA